MGGGNRRARGIGAVLGGALLAAAGAAAAEPFRSTGEISGYPLPPVGTRVQYTEDYSLEVIDVWPEAGAVTVLSDDPVYGTERITLAFGIDWFDWALLENGAVVDRTEYLFNAAILADAWPLTPGYAARYYTLEIGAQQEGVERTPIVAALEIGAAERIDSPLGRLPVIRTTLTLDLGADETGAETVNVYTRWFHPDFGLPVRAVDTFHYGDEPPTTVVFDLVDISFPDG